MLHEYKFNGTNKTATKDDSKEPIISRYTR
jgi:hypothetical protein